jgi:hypothetical protein
MWTTLLHLTKPKFLDVRDTPVLALNKSCCLHEGSAHPPPPRAPETSMHTRVSQVSLQIC